VSSAKLQILSIRGRSVPELLALAVLIVLFAIQLVHIVLGYAAGDYLVLQGQLDQTKELRRYWKREELIGIADGRLRSYYPPFRSRPPVLDISDERALLTAVSTKGVDAKAVFSDVLDDLNSRVRSRMALHPLRSASSCNCVSPAILPEDASAISMYEIRVAPFADMSSRRALSALAPTRLLRDAVTLREVRVVPYSGVKSLDVLATLVLVASIALFLARPRDSGVASGAQQ